MSARARPRLSAAAGARAINAPRRSRFAAALHAVLAASLAQGLAVAQEETAALPASIARLPPLPVATESEAAVRRALALVEGRQEEVVLRWIEICRVPGLPGHEAERARLWARWLRELGLSVRILPEGSVEATLPGARPGPPAVISAHLDALHVETADNRVRRDGPTLRGPGVLDDGSGLAAIYGATRCLVEAGWKPRQEVRVLATVGEEVGLVGARAHVAANPVQRAFVAVDGILGAVDYGATGISWTRYTFEGRGGHALLARRTPSPAFAAGRTIAALASIAEETDDPLNVSSLDGPGTPNAIPPRVSFTVDARSDDPLALVRLERDVLRVARAAAEREGVDLSVETLQSMPAARLPGHATSTLVSGAAAILEWLGRSPATFPRGSSDHNAALIAGIPAIAVGATLGRHAHSPEEHADIPTLEAGTRQVLLLMVLLGDGLDAPAAEGALATPVAQ